jgi:hypothetical protein
MIELTIDSFFELHECRQRMCGQNGLLMHFVSSKPHVNSRRFLL